MTMHATPLGLSRILASIDTLWLFAARVEPLNDLKTKGLKGSPNKGSECKLYTSKREIREYATPEEIIAAKE